MVLIGSHDSTAYTLDWNPRFWPAFSGWNFLRTLARITLLLKAYIQSLTLTQKLDIGAQLNAGVRAFDIRVARRLTNSEWYCAHTFGTIRVESFFEQLRESVEEEELHVFIRHDYQSSSMVGYEAEFVRFLEGLEIPESIHLYYAHLNGTESKRVQNFRGHHIVWLNAQSVPELEERFHTFNITRKSLLNLVLTPDRSHLRSVKKLTRPLNAEIDELLLRLFREHPQPPFAVFLDFVDESLVRKVEAAFNKLAAAQ